ncbi:unnamed protein product [Brassica napus]|nr:unnamed protein product [Brassica napus]
MRIRYLLFSFLLYLVSENEQLMVLANTNVDFPDVFGDVCGIKTTFTMRIRPFNVLWLYGSDDGSSSKASKYGSVKKIERVTLAELNNYVLNSPPQSTSESLQQAALPRCIQDIIVQNLTFQLKLFEIHFSSTVVRDDMPGAVQTLKPTLVLTKSISENNT